MNEDGRPLLLGRIPGIMPVWFRSLLLLPPFLLASAPPASADWFYPFVEYSCDAEHDRLTITYGGVWNDPESAKGPDRWSLWDLISTTDEGLITEQRTVGRTCELSSGPYYVTIGPIPGNANVTKRCGAAMFAWAQISGAGRSERYEFERDCHSDDDIIREISVRGDNPGQPEIKMVPKHEKYE